jgi:hypothetical protein
MARIGCWDFTSDTPTRDQDGMWDDLELMYINHASANADRDFPGPWLELNASHWARAQGYRGGEISERTMVVWLELTDLSAPHQAGAAMSLATQKDTFDALVFAEQHERAWQHGSDWYRRSGGGHFAETDVRGRIVLVAAFGSDNGQSVARFYRNGELAFESRKGDAATWSAEDIEILFGTRHAASVGGNPPTALGHLNARIYRAELHDHAFTAEEAAATYGPLERFVVAARRVSAALRERGVAEETASAFEFAAFDLGEGAFVEAVTKMSVACKTAKRASVDDALIDEVDALLSALNDHFASRGFRMATMETYRHTWRDEKSRGDMPLFHLQIVFLNYQHTYKTWVEQIWDDADHRLITEDLLSGAPIYALLVGVSDYSRHDAAMGLPLGTSDLKGCEQDVISFASLARSLGVRDEHMRVLTNPRLDANDFPGLAVGWTPNLSTTMESARFGYATAAEIRAGVAWLAERLRADPSARGIVYMSGHSSWIVRDGTSKPAFCPADVGVPREADLPGALSYDEMAMPFADIPDSQSLFVVLDTCFEEGATRTLTRTGAEPAAYTFPLRERDLVIAASEMGEKSYSRVFDGVWHGAFTWALATILGQYPLNLSRRGRWFDVHYGELMDKITMFLGALSIEQKPTLHWARDSRENRRAWPAFGELDWQPEGRILPSRDDSEVDGGEIGWGYTIKQGASKLGTLIVTTNQRQVNGHTFEANTDFWFFLPGVSGLPAGNFQLERHALDTNTTVPAPSAAAYTFDSLAFSGAATLQTVSGNGYEIHTTANHTDKIGYLVPGSNSLVWFQREAETDKRFTGANLYFKYVAGMNESEKVRKLTDS